MSQTVKIDAAAQDAIAEIVGMPWEKDYFDNTHDKDSAHVATVTREGVSVRIYICDESLCSADLWSFEAEQIGKAILNAAKDAKTFQKAQSEWARSQMQRLNCEIKGTQNMWGYGFYVNGRHYEVHFTTNEIARTCVILNQAAKPIFQKVTEDVSKVSQDDAALLLKTFLISKIKEDEECLSR
ncbi:MAG: hypothetical protein ACLTS9_03560 [Sutterella wadsworthensis]|jgi:hypothetical protein|nr:MAG TPA: hypothetical protein [Caudoviricetes sp.]